MVSKLGTERCTNNDAGPRKGVDCEIPQVEDGNETFFL